MTPIEFLMSVLILIGMATLRFGVPMLVMWLINKACCRLNPQQVAQPG